MLASVLETPWLGDTNVPCRTEPDLFFAEAPADVEAAKAVCGACPVREQCLADALDRKEPWGVWAGSCSSPARSWRASARAVVPGRTPRRSRPEPPPPAPTHSKPPPKDPR